jgi:hypothetical protein
MRSFNDFVSDEKADSMIAFVIVGGVLSFGLIFTLLSVTFNSPIQYMNTLIDTGGVSADTITHFETMLYMWGISPFFFLIGLIIFCYERSKGESVDSGTFFSYLMLMIIGLVMSAYLIWGFGCSVDQIISLFNENTFFTDYGAEFDVSGSNVIFRTLIYYICLMPGFITSILFMLFPILKQRENASFLGTDEENQTQGGETISNYSLEQM